MNHCPFCQIVSRQAPAAILCESALAMAFAPLHPVAAGHTLVVPKVHCESLVDITDELLQGVLALAKSVALDLLAKTGATGINLLHATGKDAEQSVFHFHMHVVPRHPNDGLNLWFH